MGLVYFKTCLGKHGPPDLNHQLTIGSWVMSGYFRNILQISLHSTNKMAQNLNWRSAFAKIHLNERSVCKLSNISFHFERWQEKQKQCQKTDHFMTIILPLGLLHPPSTCILGRTIVLKSNSWNSHENCSYWQRVCGLTQYIHTHVYIYIYIYMVHENYHPIILPKYRYLYMFYNFVKVCHDKFHSSSWLVDYNL